MSINLKSRYDIGWFSAYDTLKGMVLLYGIGKVKEALAEIEGNLTQRAADLPNVTLYKHCPFCQHFHPSNQACPDTTASR